MTLDATTWSEEFEADFADGGTHEATVVRIAAAVNDLLDEDSRTRTNNLTRMDEQLLAQAKTMTVIEQEGNARAAAGLPMWTADEEAQIRDEVIGRMFGLDKLNRHIKNPLVEDIYIDGCNPIHLRLSTGEIVEQPPVANTNEELLALLRRAAIHGTETERQMTATKPFLDLRLPEGQRGAVMWDVTPDPVVTIRCHRFIDVTLDDLVEMGMVSPLMARFLAAAVRGRRTIVVTGPQGAGKTLLLRALARAVSVNERIATLETERELHLHHLKDPNGRKQFKLLIPIEAREGSGEIGANGRPAGEVSLADLVPASLRHSVRRLLIGEMRAEEIVPAVLAMGRGYAGTLTSFHANSAEGAFTALSSALMLYRGNIDNSAARSMVADAVDLFVHVDMEVTAAGTNRYVSDILEIGQGLTHDLRSISTPIFQPREDLEDTDPRGYFALAPEKTLWLRRGGLSPDELTPANDGWTQHFPPRLLA